MFVVIFIFSCDSVVNEANRIIKVYFETERNMDYEELFSFLILVKIKKPCFSAVDFFDLNRKSLFSLLSVTTTYFIILVQFHQQYEYGEK